MKYVIIGGGIAGTGAAEEIRKKEKDAEITIIAREDLSLYSKVLLQNYVIGTVDRSRLFLKKDEWYAENNIVYMRGVDVVKIDAKNKFVATSEWREIPYDKLLITTGGEPRLLPYDMKGVVYFRTLNDADNLLALIGTVNTLPNDQKNVVVYGGGFISLELINIFKKANFNISVIMRSDGFWSRQMSDYSKTLIRKQIERQGIKIYFNESEMTLLGETELEGVQLQSGEKIPAKILGVGIGLEKSLSLFSDAGIKINSGILSDEYLRTNVEDIFTAGDVAEFFDVNFKRHVQFGNWLNAIMQGKLAGKNMTGEENQFEIVSSFAINIFGLNVTLVGDTIRKNADEIIQEVATEDSLEIFKKDGKIVGAILIGDVSRRQELTNAIKNGK